MTDPFDALRVPAAAVAPDPAFARALRTRVERAVLDLPEDPMTATVTQDATATALRLHTVTPYLAVADAAAALDFYVAAFGAVRRGEPIVMPDGRIGHAEVALGDSVLMLADEFPEIGLVAPVHRGGASQSLRLEVPDPDAVVARALAAGGALDRPVTDSPHGRGGSVLDPSGHRWMVARGTPAGPAPGEVAYASLWTRDTDRAARFYGAVLGWATGAGRAGERQVTNLASRFGLFGGPRDATLYLCHTVADVEATVAVVRAAGGTAQDPEHLPYGRVADCVDDQGLPFAVFAAAGPPTGPAGPTVEAGHGELDRFELRVPDAGRARAFYGTVLGWRFAPGTETDHWRVGALNSLVGGLAQASAVAWFAVTDLDTAVAATRAAGGRADDPRRGSAGRSAACADDQGALFILVQR